MGPKFARPSLFADTLHDYRNNGDGLVEAAALV